MRLNKKNHGSEMPHLDLIPLMDVILTILTFFILASLSLTNKQGVVNLNLPSTASGVSEQATPDPLVVELDKQAQLVVAGKPAGDAELAQQIQSYLSSNAKGSVILKADKDMPYEKVVQALGKMRDVGGDRVSLAIDG